MKSFSSSRGSTPTNKRRGGGGTQPESPLGTETTTNVVPERGTNLEEPPLRRVAQQQESEKEEQQKKGLAARLMSNNLGEMKRTGSNLSLSSLSSTSPLSFLKKRLSGGDPTSVSSSSNSTNNHARPSSWEIGRSALGYSPSPRSSRGSAVDVNDYSRWNSGSQNVWFETDLPETGRVWIHDAGVLPHATQRPHATIIALHPGRNGLDARLVRLRLDNMDKRAERDVASETAQLSMLSENVDIQRMKMAAARFAFQRFKVERGKIHTLADLLHAVGLDHAVDVFERKNIDLAAVFFLGERELSDLGLVMGARTRLAVAIACLRGKQSQPSWAQAFFPGSETSTPQSSPLLKPMSSLSSTSSSPLVLSNGKKKILPDLKSDDLDLEDDEKEEEEEEEPPPIPPFPKDLYDWEDAMPPPPSQPPPPPPPLLPPPHSLIRAPPNYPPPKPPPLPPRPPQVSRANNTQVAEASPVMKHDHVLPDELCHEDDVNDAPDDDDDEESSQDSLDLL